MTRKLHHGKNRFEINVERKGSLDCRLFERFKWVRSKARSVNPTNTPDSMSLVPGSKDSLSHVTVEDSVFLKVTLLVTVEFSNLSILFNIFLVGRFEQEEIVKQKAPSNNGSKHLYRRGRRKMFYL